MLGSISGTKEWAANSVNCVTGCSHDCRYCYARFNAQNRYGRVKPGQWPVEVIRTADVAKPRRKLAGRVMFPTTHDITPNTLDACTTVLWNLLQAGNEVLIVSKPHLPCIRSLCNVLQSHRFRIMFRFTIGAADDSILSYWEPGAPLFAERFAALQYAHSAGFATSVSMEPLLDSANVSATVAMLSPFVTDSIWVGMLNSIRSRVACRSAADMAEIVRVEQGQTLSAVHSVYAQLRDRPLMRWKESYKRVLGLELATTAGLDI